MYLIADGSNPNNSPFIAIEHADDVRGYECEVYKYDGLISYDIIDNNVCYIHNLEEIRMYSEKCLRNVNSLVRANVREEVRKQIETLRQITILQLKHLLPYLFLQHPMLSFY